MASKAIGFLNFKFSADLSGFERAMNKAQKKLKKFGKSVERTGKNMTMGLTLPIVALGGAAIKTFADFEQAMLKVKAVSGATGKDFEKLTESAKKLGASTMFSASQVAELQLELSKLGFSSDQILNSTDAVLKLAQATDTELAAAAETTAVAINAFGLEASDAAMIADVFAQASSSAAVDMEKLAAVLPNAASTARAFGDDVVQMTAKIQTLADVTGMEGGKLGTHMKLIYKGLATNGLTYEEAMEKIRNSTDKIAVATKLFGGNAFGSAIALSEVTEKTKQYEIELRKSGGAAQRMADIMDSGVAGAMRRLKSQTEGLLIQLGTALMPVFQKMMDALSSLVEWFSGLTKEQKDNIVKWGLILAAIGPVLIIIGKMSIGIGALIRVFSKLGTFLVANPWLLVAAAVGLLAYKIYSLVKGTEKLATVQDELNGITQTAEEAITGQKIEVDLLTKELKSQETTLGDKKIALDKLKKISPQYYGSLKIAKGVVEGLDQATQNYTTSILEQAKMEANKERLVKLNIELMRKQEGRLNFIALVEAKNADLRGAYNIKRTSWYKDALAQNKKETESIQDRIEVLGQEYTVLQKNRGVTTEKDKAIIQMKELNKALQDQIQSNIENIKANREYNESVEEVTESTETVITEQEKWAIAQSNLSEETKGLLDELTKLPPATLEVGKSFEDIFPKEGEQKFKKLSRFFERLKEDMVFLFGDLDELNENFMAALNGLLGALDAFNNKMRIKAQNENKRKTKEIDSNYEREKAAIEKSGRSEEDKAKLIEALDKKTNAAKVKVEEETEKKLAKIRKREAIQKKAMSIVDVIITTATAVMNAIAASPLTFGMPWSGIIAGLGAAQIGIIASTPLPMAEGGIVSGPTQILAGEYPGAGSNPEVVAPLDKLKSMIGDGNQHITVTGKLIGNDIFLSNAKTGFNRLRTV